MFNFALLSPVNLTDPSSFLSHLVLILIDEYGHFFFNSELTLTHN